MWQQKAENDLKVVHKELSSSDPVTDVACFHCQQAAEKYLKSFLISRGVEPRKTHLLGELLIACLKLNTEFSVLQDTLFLSEYAVEIRYPDEFYIPTVEECHKAEAAALRVKELVIDLMK